MGMGWKGIIIFVARSTAKPWPKEYYYEKHAPPLRCCAPHGGLFVRKLFVFSTTGGSKYPLPMSTGDKPLVVPRPLSPGTPGERCSTLRSRRRRTSTRPSSHSTCKTLPATPRAEQHHRYLHGAHPQSVLLVSANDVSVQGSIEKAYDAGVPVILLDRGIESDKYTCLIGGDKAYGYRPSSRRVRGEDAEWQGHGPMIQGIAAAADAYSRTTDGFMEVMKKFPASR